MDPLLSVPDVIRLADTGVDTLVDIGKDKLGYLSQLITYYYARKARHRTVEVTYYL